jgi:hypothetical protein
VDESPPEPLDPLPEVRSHSHLWSSSSQSAWYPTPQAGFGGRFDEPQAARLGARATKATATIATWIRPRRRADAGRVASSTPGSADIARPGADAVPTDVDTAGRTDARSRDRDADRGRRAGACPGATTGAGRDVESRCETGGAGSDPMTERWTDDGVGLGGAGRVDGDDEGGDGAGEGASTRRLPGTIARDMGTDIDGLLAGATQILRTESALSHQKGRR